MIKTGFRLASLFSLLVALAGCTFFPSDLFSEWTGEEELFGQIRGTIQLASTPLHPQPNVARYEPVAYTGMNPFGINVFLEDEVELWKRERIIQMISEAGFHWIRQQFSWEDIEIHGKGDYEDRRNIPYRSSWDKYDHIVELAEQYDVEIIARLSNPPAWSRASGDEQGAFAPPDNFEDFGDYVTNIVSRYRGRIRFYQIWNEPNIYPEWGEQAVDPVAYTQLLCLAYQRAKEADPEAVIISGALAQTEALSGRDLSDTIFLQRMYDAGAGACFDIISVNDYILWSGPTDQRMHPQEINFGRPRYIRDIMVANGDAAKPVWISEVNANAVPNDPAIQDWGRYGQVSLEQQARYAPLAYQRTIEEWPWVGVVNFWFFKRASDWEQNQSWYYFRMVEPDFTPLPVYAAMSDYINGLTPTLYPGTHQQDHWALTYTGDWETQADPQAVLGTYRQSEQVGATFSARFHGSQLTLIPGPQNGEIEVTIDEAPPQRIILDGQPVQLFSAGISAPHRLHITVQAGRVGIDSITVREQNGTRLTVGGILALLVLTSLIYVGIRRYRRTQHRSASRPSPTRSP